MTIAEEIRILEERLAATDDDRAQAEVILQILSLYLRMRSTEGQPYIDRLLQMAEAIGDDRYRGYALYHQSLIARHAGDYDASVRLSGWAIDMFTRVGDQAGLAGCYNNLGNVYQFQGNYGDALRDHMQALTIRQDIGDKAGIATSLSNIAIIYYSQGNLDQALENNHQSLQMMREIGNQQGISNALTNIGNVYYEQQNYEEALRHYRSCLDIQVEMGSQYGMASALCNIGSVYRHQGHYGEALENYTQALKLFDTVGGRDGQALVLNNIGLIYCVQDEYRYAVDTHIRALAISEEIGNKEEIRNAFQGLTEAYRALGDHELALDYHIKYHEVEKEMLGRHAQKQIIQLSFQHDIEMREKEAILLKEKNDAINIYAQKLEVSNNELKQFANVASHDLREPLRMVTSYMTLLEKTLGDKIEPVQKQFIGFAIDGAKRMENLIHDLLRLAKVDANPKIEQVWLPSIVADVCSNLEILLREKNAQIIAPEMPAIMADRTQVMQLFQNIIGNGIKYNEQEQPTITISFTTRTTDVLLSIADNGIGIPADYRERAFQIFQRVPTAKSYQGTGIGLAICKKIVDGWGGTIAIDHNPGGGSVFHITMPVGIVC